MNAIPRLALASLAGRPQPSVAALAWLAGLAERGSRVQYFCSRACPIGTVVVNQITGLPGRHLDAWLMTEGLLKSLFARGTRRADMALIEGALDGPTTPWLCCQGGSGSLRPIADALDTPKVLVIDCPARDGFHLPAVPDDVDAIFLDGLEDPADFEALRTFITLTTGKPVVGALERLPDLREALIRVPRDADVPAEWLGRLAASFARFADIEAIRSLARSRPFAGGLVAADSRGGPRIRVAYAIDPAFGGYFPDTLEALESLGAELLDFSPLRDERLPDRADLVMIGCGFPDHYASSLAGNVSLIAELQAYVHHGGRLYAEGGGTAYLGRRMYLGGGYSVDGAAILPFDAVLVDDAGPPIPVERTLQAGSWLGPAGTTVRGYRSRRWQLAPGTPSPAERGPSGPLVPEADLFAHRRAVGGLMHLHLAALADLIPAFVDAGELPGRAARRTS